ncbi:MAG: MCE family protein, partial [Succinivibrionaceae bacterium]|nr:MCE family protein [Succinivibrionaceae bacterium]
MFSNFKARASKIGSWSAVWLVPLVALLIGVWLIYDYYSSRGEEIILYSQKADGLEAGKTLIKIRNVEVGKVTSISLSNDLSKVIVRARMSAGTDEFLHEDSSFWVVKPSIGVRGVSGLDTIMSGQYIELYPGKSEKLSRQFDLMDQPRVLNGDEKGTSFILYSKDKKSSVDVSTPIRFKGYEVGVIT